MSDPRLNRLSQLRQRALEGGGAKRIARQHAKGKQTARERLAMLLDEGTFHELEPFVTLREDELNNRIRAPRAGTVAQVHVSPGQQVQYGDLLVTFADAGQ